MKNMYTDCIQWGWVISYKFGVQAKQNKPPPQYIKPWSGHFPIKCIKHVWKHLIISWMSISKDVSLFLTFCKNTYERDEGEIKAESTVYRVHNFIGRVRFGINSFFQDARNSFFEHIFCHMKFVTSSRFKKMSTKSSHHKFWFLKWV